MKIKSAVRKRTAIITSVYYSLLFIFLGFICVNTPLISDDFEFADLALTNPRDLISYVLYYGNGRLMGNLTGIFLINYPILCGLIKAVTFCGIIWLLPRVITVSSKNRVFLAAFVPLLVLGVNPDIAGQVLTWTSGWANFIPPILIGLLCLYVIQSRNRFSFKAAALIVVLGFLGQLYVEHATAIQILSALCLLVYYHKRGHKIQARYTLYWLVAGLCGAALMFAIPKVFFLEVNRTTGYRTFHIHDFVGHAFGALLFSISTFEQCIALLSVFSLFGFLVNKGRSAIALLKKTVYLLSPVFLGIYPFLNISWSILELAKHGLTLIYLALLLIDILLMKDQVKKLAVLWLGILAIIATAPFLVITPFGERCMHLSYTLLCIAALICVNSCIESDDSIPAKLLQCASAISTAAVCVILAVSMAKMRHYDNIRDSYIRQQIAAGETEIVVFDLPTRYAFNTYLLDLYYYDQQPKDVSFEIIDLDTWMQTYYQGS